MTSDVPRMRVFLLPVPESEIFEGMMGSLSAQAILERSQKDLIGSTLYTSKEYVPVEGF